ncbi:hypothetical protein NCS52_00565400 [Fusarium sp. LHS14.1]|nr:hypothetical protein NCS52_00565400 [Fusarium sp. LHS14.1]
MVETRICQESFKGAPLPKDRDASTLIEIVDNEAPGNRIVDTLPINEPPTEKQPASETDVHVPPASGHSKDKSNKPPPPGSCSQSLGTASTEPMSVPMRRKLQATLAEPSGTEATQLPTGTKPKSAVTAMAQTATVTTVEVINTTPAQLREDMAQIVKEMKALKAEFPETVEAKQTWLQRSKFGKRRLLPLSDKANAILVAEYVSPEERIATGLSLQDMNAAIKALIEKRAMARTAIAQAEAADQSTTPGQAIETMEATESPETAEAKLAWLRGLDESSIRIVAVDFPREAIPRAELYAGQLLEKLVKINVTVSVAKIAELQPKMRQTILVHIPAELQEAVTKAMQRVEKLKTLRRTVARLPEIAEGTKLPLDLKKRAADTVKGLKTTRTLLPMHLERHGATQFHMLRAGRVFKQFSLAEAVITARLRLTGDTVEGPAAGKHAGPTYPWGVFKEVEADAKTTKDYEVSIARRGLKEREADLRDVTGAQLSLKKIKFLLHSISTQCCDLGVDLFRQGARSE